MKTHPHPRPHRILAALFRGTMLLAALTPLWCWAQLEVTSTGVGVGTSSPSAKLDVAGGYTTSSLSTGSSLKLASQGSSPDAAQVYWGDNSGWKLHFGTSASGTWTPRVTFLDTGKVGIGTTSPARLLSVNSTATSSTELAGFLAPSVSSGSVIYALIGRAAASGESAIWGYQYQSTTSDSFAWIANYGDNHATSGLIVRKGGNVGIGTTSPGYKLEVSGSVRATSFISDSTTYADFVFAPDYRLPPLSEVAARITAQGHLPDIPSAAEAKTKGIDLAAMQVKLLQKVEELTLYAIEQNKRIEAMQTEIQQLKAQTPTQP
jgi:hypothetical protein